MPYGLLRVASWLRGKGYMLKLIDCMEANKQRTVPKQKRLVRKLCSTECYKPDNWGKYRPEPDEKIEYIFGMPLSELRKRLVAIKVWKVLWERRPVKAILIAHSQTGRRSIEREWIATSAKQAAQSHFGLRRFGRTPFDARP